MIKGQKVERGAEIEKKKTKEKKSVIYNYTIKVCSPTLACKCWLLVCVISLAMNDTTVKLRWKLAKIFLVLITVNVVLMLRVVLSRFLCC